MKFPFTGMFGQGLNNSDGQTIFRSLEYKNLFPCGAAALLLPLKYLFHAWMLNHCHAFVVVKEPLDYLWN
jgi:hypothetical protein